MRKAFNFYRSYYDVAKELSKKDREEFLMAILQKQFEGIEPELTGMAKFAYLSQQHSIDSQVKGYEDKTKEKLTPIEGGTEGGTQGGSVQEKGKEKGKEEVEYTIIHPLVEYLNTNCPQVQGLASPINNLDAVRLLVEFDKYDLVEVFMAMENTKQLKRKYNSANLTVRSWIKTRQKSNSTFGQIKQQNKVKAAWE
jgi:DNA repair ATPase RecN